MSTPKVSIVLPVYNGARFLRGAIETCLAQTYRDIELIVVDDCSTDETPRIVASFRDPRLRYIRHDRNRRLPASLNTGFAHARGEYLTWTSDDNEYAPEAIERMVAYLEADLGADFVYADMWVLDEETGKKSHKKLPDTLNLRERNDVGGCFLYTRRAYRKVGRYNPDLEIVEDYDYFIRIASRFRVAHCPEPLYLYRTHGGSLTNTRKTSQLLFDRVVKYRNGYLTLGEFSREVNGYLPAPQLYGRLFRLSPVLGFVMTAKWLRSRMKKKAGVR